MKYAENATDIGYIPIFYNFVLQPHCISETNGILLTDMVISQPIMKTDISNQGHW